MIRPGGTLYEAAQQANPKTSSARTLALAGFHAYLFQGDATLAQSRFDASVQKDSSEPYGLFGQLVMAQRRGHPERALAAALRLCEKGASHPLSTSAARFVSENVAISPALDDEILLRAPKALATGTLSGDAVHLLRNAIAQIFANRDAQRELQTVLKEMGAMGKGTLLGPFSAYHLLDFDHPVDPEKSGSLAGPFKGPFGEIKPHQIAFPEGHLTLANEGPLGDVYLLAADAEILEAGTYVVRAATHAPHKLYLDGTLLFENRAFERAEPLLKAKAILLTKGVHRVLIKLIKNDRAADLTLFVSRADGGPANVRFFAATEAAPQWAGAQSADVRMLLPSPADFAAALKHEVGLELARYLAVLEGAGWDRDGAKALLTQLSSTLKGPAITSLRADLTLGDPTIPNRVAQGRVSADLEATLEKDRSDVSALLTKGVLALEVGQLMQASEALKQARAAHSPVGFPVPMLEARVELALGLDAQADQSALEALSLQPGLCEALGLRYDIARRREAVGLADSLIEPLKACPGSAIRAAEHAKLRGDSITATRTLEHLVARDPGSVSSLLALSSHYVSQKRFEDAAHLLDVEQAMWPRNAALFKQLGDVQEFWGKRAEALTARDRALLLDGGDLTLRRSVERTRTGKEPLADYAIDTKTAISAYEGQRGAEDAAGAYALDMAAIRVYPDGSMVDRIHIIQRVLNQAGISEIAEVTIPPRAQVLTLRTLKADGTTLEPESIEGKETISLPGVGVGDYVEYEFLEAHPSRGPAEPGFTASNFYFQIARMPNNWSTYTVIAAAGTGMSVDPHNMKSPGVQAKGDLEVFTHAERHVPPLIPEPNSAPSPTEYLPFVSVGGGSTGNEARVAAYADAYLERGQLTAEIEQFARNAAQGKKGRAAVEALYAAVMKHLSGRDAGLTQSASASIAQGRGSRLWALKASLEALGIPARVAFVRTFAADPAPYRFPADVLITYVCLLVEPTDGPLIWLDPQIRFAPFGQLPEPAAGGRDAWLLPEPTRPLRKVKTLMQPPRLGKEVRLSLKVGLDGTLSGSGEESYVGFEAAQLGESLDSLPPNQRDQALQSALSRYFGGAELSSVKAEVKHQVGAPVVVSYAFTVPHFARPEGAGRLVLPPLTLVAHLGRRYVQVGSRKTPLYIDGTEQSHTVARVELPPGFSLSAPLGEAKATGAYGTFVRREKQVGNQLLIDEDYQLKMERVPVNKYDDFAQFAGEVDLLQSRDLTLEKKQYRVQR